MHYHVDGELRAAEEATVSVRDRGFMYGDAAFETLRAYGGEVFAWDAHADRLERTCETLGFAAAIPPREDLRERIDATLAANDLAEAYVKLSITRGVQPGKLTPDRAVDPTIVIQVRPLPRGGVDGSPVWDGPATVRTVDRQRVPDAAIPADAKTHNYLNGILARLDLRRGEGRDGEDEQRAGRDGEDEQRAGRDSKDEQRAGRDSEDEQPAGRIGEGKQPAGRDGAGGQAASRDGEDGQAEEALMLDAEGSLTEGATSNLWFVVDGVLHTPSTDLPILPGVTRSIVLDLARAEDLPVETGRYDREALRSADEAFLTNTTWELRPVGSVDGASIGGGPITDLLARLYDRRVERSCY